MTRAPALLFVSALWAGIFLPGLGSTEIKGEEGRRILPGVEMLESGDWLVPHLHGQPYLRKPPLVNWVIALSIKVCGVRNEWTARLPSVFAVLALVLTTVWTLSPWCGANVAVLAAIVMMTNLGLLEKGRLAEIEAIYISLSGLAFVCWLGAWAGKKSAWQTWLLPFVFLGLGLLAKGPVHLLFFYAAVIPILWSAGEMRQLVRAPHLAGMVAMLAIFAAWAVPYFLATRGLHAAEVWVKQMEERVGGGSLEIGAWLANFPRGLGNFLPWLFFLPLLWNRAALAKLGHPERALIVAARWPVLVFFFALLLIPGMLPRYTLPMLVPASVLLALVMTAHFGARALRWSGFAGSAVAVGMCVYAVAIVPRVNAAADVRPVGERLNASIPAGEPLYVYDPGLAPLMFYIHAHCVYPGAVRDLPEEGAVVFTRAAGAAKLRKTWRDARVLAEAADKNKNHFFVLQLRGKL